MATTFPVRAELDPSGIDKLIVLLTKAGKEANMTDKEIKEMNDQIKNTGKTGNESLGNINKGLNNLVNDGLKKVGTAFLAAFAIDRLLNVGKEIIHITAEFQKMEAVLTNSLGSRSAAQIAMRQIEEIAARTPFSVQELTASYVKLVNQGFKPTEAEIIKLGDLSASTGKSFDQLTEAIIDAQTGEFERLKEFGIRASKEGDKVTFTFKGVQTQTEFTSEAIRDYVLSLGDAEGVSGSMAAISETLGGNISNLGDAWDHFLKVLGDGEKGPLQNAVRNLSLLLAVATEWVKTDDQIFEDQKIEAQTKAVENIKALAAGYGSLKEAGEAYLNLLKGTLQVQYATMSRLRPFDKDGNYIKEIGDRSNAIQQQINITKAEIQAVEDYIKAEENKTTATQKNTKAVKENHKAHRDFIDEVMQPYIERQKALNKELEEQAKLLKYTESIDPYKNYNPFDSSTIEIDPEVTDSGTSEAHDQMVRNRLQQQADFKNQLQQESFDFAVFLAQSLFDFNDQLYDQERVRLEEQRDYELSLAGDNADAKKRINKRFDDEQKALKTKQAQRDREQALFNIGINTAQGVMAALASVPPNVPLSVLIGAIGILQAGVVASKPLPKFAKGVFDLDGPGTTTSDSIPAMLSKHETVVPANNSMKFADIARSMVENPNLTWTDIANIVDKNTPGRLRAGLLRNIDNGGSTMMLEEMRGMRKDIRNKRELHVDIDERGFRKWVREGDSWTEHIDKRYSSSF